jgi:hypothetical protein
VLSTNGCLEGKDSVDGAEGIVNDGSGEFAIQCPDGDTAGKYCDVFEVADFAATGRRRLQGTGGPVRIIVGSKQVSTRDDFKKGARIGGAEGFSAARVESSFDCDVMGHPAEARAPSAPPMWQLVCEDPITCELLEAGAELSSRQLLHYKNGNNDPTHCDPNPHTSGGGKCECFPGDATVTLEDGSTKSMTEVAIGDRVLTMDASGALAFSDVYMFGHLDRHATGAFITITTESGAMLRLTPDHYLPTSSATVTDSKAGTDAWDNHIMLPAGRVTKDLRVWVAATPGAPTLEKVVDVALHADKVCCHWGTRT